MMKSSTPIIIVDSVEKAVKFYTEKLAFDIVELTLNKEEGAGQTLNYAQLRKGKCFIMFRVPHIEELAEFSFIKRCASRCIGIYSEMKKGIDKYYAKCNKKEVQIVGELKDMPWGHKVFSVKDPFGVRISFAQPIEGYVAKPKDFAGMRPAVGQKSDDELVEEMVKYLKSFGILRRAAKKYSKLWIKKSKK